jgi:NADPH:quinone reductase-like Zn-dependent oxidoreductase
MAWKGRFLVIGFAAGKIPEIPLNLALLKGCSIVGVFWGQFTMKEPKVNMKYLTELMQMYGQGLIKPHVSKTFRYNLQTRRSEIEKTRTACHSIKYDTENRVVVKQAACGQDLTGTIAC